MHNQELKKIPLNPPLPKGDAEGSRVPTTFRLPLWKTGTESASPFEKGGLRGI